jgi:ornithine racemase
MNRITIDEEALRHNLDRVRYLVGRHGAHLTVVTKSLCGNPEVLRILRESSVDSIADSRLQNLEAMGELGGGLQRWYLRPPHHSALADVVRLSDVSLNSELSTIRLLSEEAERQGVTHQVIIMIELGDLREGILPGSLVEVYEDVFALPNVEVLGIGSNLGCLSGTVPNIDQFMQLALYRELLELKFGRELPLISAGTSAVLPLLVDGVLPRPINHFRVGESIFLGTDLVHGGQLEGFRDDAVLLEAEIVEMKEKALVALGETADVAPFGTIEHNEPQPGQRGYRAILTLGQLDTDVGALEPVEPDHQIAGASSDLTVVNLGPKSGGLRVGDCIRFRMGYSAFVRLMSNPYTRQQVRRATGLAPLEAREGPAPLLSLAGHPIGQA